MERVFSQGRQLLEFTRNRLLGNSIRLLLCLGDWCQKDLVDTGDILEAIRCSNRKQKWWLSVASDEMHN